MTYENVKFRDSNMVMVDGYFYSFDSTDNILLCKVDDGDTAFSYPLDIIFTKCNSYDLEGSYSTHYDGFYFWTLQRIVGDVGVVIRKWDISGGALCELHEEFIYENSALDTYVSSSMALENYCTTVVSGINVGDTQIQIDEYYDSIVTSGTKLYLGPNFYDSREEVTVSGVYGNSVTIVSGAQYSYDHGDFVHITPSFFIFNEYSGTSSSGSLMRINSETGILISRDTSSEYKSVNASVFHRLQNVLENYSDAHALIYVKGAQAKLRNMSDLTNIYTADSRNEYFTGSDYSYPNDTDWERTGTPYILDNSLFLNTTIDGTDKISSKYRITGDFSVQVSGSLGGYTVYDAAGKYLDHYLAVDIYKLGFMYTNDVREGLYAEYLMDQITGSDLIDTSGNNFNGIIYGTPTQVSGARNPLGYVLDLGGDGDAVQLLDSATMDVIEDEFSISLWFRSQIDDGHSSAGIITRDCSDNFCLLLNQSQTFPQSLSVYYSHNQDTSLGAVVQSGTWYHVVMSWDVPNTTFKIYLNNSEVFSTTSCNGFSSYDRPVVLGCNTEGSIRPGSYEFKGQIDDVKIYSRVITETEIDRLYTESGNYEYLYVSQPGSVQVTQDVPVTSGTNPYNYQFKVDRVYDTYDFYYKTLISGGEFDPNWNLFTTITGSPAECQIGMGLTSASVTVSGSYFDNLIYDGGHLYYHVDTPSFYGIMQMDNVESDGFTNIEVYDISAYRGTLYRLQDQATYYGSDYSWSTYNYQLAPLRSFVNSISVSVYPSILPANAINVSQLTAIVLDQYGEGCNNIAVFFTDDDNVGFVTTSPAYTDYLEKTGEALSNYKAGTAVRTVTIEGTATQYD